ncbi:MAG: hypothetical protein FWC11_06985 [Firmicutes bacterium]|nr:hypothetical protein [Bacillota bacterium]
MDTKKFKFLQTFESFIQVDFFSDKNILTKHMKSFLSLDYSQAIDVWVYLITTRENDLLKNTRIATMLGDDMFNLFFSNNSQKCLKALSDEIMLKKAVYQYCANSLTGENFKLLVNLIVSTKLEFADEILKCVIKNEKIKYGEAMKKLLEAIFIELLKKNPQKIILNKKQTELLLGYVKKIKTDERAMLEQRIKETQ